MPQEPLPNSVQDKIGAVNLGMNSGLAPYLIPQEQVAFAINVAFRGGYASTRPPYWKLTLNYANEETALAMRAWFQGAAFYQSLGSQPNCLVASIGGRIYRFAISNRTAAVQEITPFLSDGVTLDRNDPTREQAWLAQGQDFLVINDGQSNPYFFDGAGVRRSRGAAGQELPPGKQLHYCNGRFIEVLPDGISYIASDLVYNTSSGTPAYNYRDSILRTTENEAILAGASFAVPITAGQITALFSTAVSDTSLGQGPLQVSTTGGIYSVNLPLDSTLWTTTQQPSQVVALPNGGPTGQYAVTTVNGDAWYRAADGIRSFVIARRDFNTWVQTPLSFEMQRILPFDTSVLLPWGSTVNFNNRLLTTCSPYRVADRGIAHRGIISLDFNNISSLTSRSQPAYDGLWTGLPILQIVKGRFDNVDRCFMFALDAQGSICLYELGYDDAAWFDFNGSTDVAQECSLESGALFGRESYSDRLTQQLKRLETGDLYMEQLVGPNSASPAGTISFTISYREDAWPFWVDWHEWTLCAKPCYTPATCIQPLPVQSQAVSFARLPVVPSSNADCNSYSGKPHREGYSFQVKLEWEGHVTLKRFNLWATAVPATKNVLCAPGTCRVLTGCLDNPFTYVIEPGPGTAGLLEWDVDNDAPTWDAGSGSTITPILS